MSLLRILWRFTIGGAWKYLAAGAGVLALYLKGRSDAKAKQAEAVAKGVEAGAKGAAQAEADLRAGKTPQQVKEANDAHWR